MISLVGAKACLNCLGAGRPCQRTLFLCLFLCATFGLVYYASNKNSVGPRSLDNMAPPEKVQNEATLLHKLDRKAWSRRLFTAVPPVGPISSNDGNSKNIVGLTVGSSTTTIKPEAWIDEEALVDQETKSIEDLVLEAAARIRNIPSTPYILGKDADGPKYFGNSSCARFPTFYDLQFSNTFWQTLRTSDGTLYLYGAYFDIRTLNPLGPTLRILGMMDRTEPKITTYCQIWFEGEAEPVFSKVLEYKYIWNKHWGNYKQSAYHPYLLTCQVPLSYHKGQVPASVSVVEEPCDVATNNLRVLFHKPDKKKAFAVCVKGLDYIQEDLSARLVEWIELLGILGADKIFIYEYALHPNATKVLRHYEQTGQIDVTPITLPGGQPNDPRIRHIYLSKNRSQKRQNEVIPYNDCLYRNLYQFEYIALLDIDEVKFPFATNGYGPDNHYGLLTEENFCWAFQVIMPMNGSGWTNLMLEGNRQSRLTKNDSSSSYNFRQVHFVDNDWQRHERLQGIPKYMYMLRNVYRSPNHEKRGDGAKCFHNPERVLTLHNHFPFACLNGPCTTYDVGLDLAQVQHYRQDCLLGLRNCSEEYRQAEVLDTTIWRYKEQLIDRARKVLGYLGFIPNYKFD